MFSAPGKMGLVGVQVLLLLLLPMLLRTIDADELGQRRKRYDWDDKKSPVPPAVAKARGQNRQAGDGAGGPDPRYKDSNNDEDNYMMTGTDLEEGWFSSTVVIGDAPIAICNKPLSHDGNNWYQMEVGLWFQAVGYILLNRHRPTTMTPWKQCPVTSGDNPCAIMFSSSIGNIFRTYEWYWESRRRFSRIEDGVFRNLIIQAGIGCNATSVLPDPKQPPQTKACVVPQGHEATLIYRVQWYEVYGYVSEWVENSKRVYTPIPHDLMGGKWSERCAFFFKAPVMDHNFWNNIECSVRPQWDHREEFPSLQRG